MGFLYQIKEFWRGREIDRLLEYLVYIYIFLLLFQTRYIIWGSLDQDFIQASLYAYDIVFLLIIAVVALSGKLQKMFSVRFRIEIILYMLFLISAFLSLVYFNFLSVYKAFRFLEAVGLFFVISRAKLLDIRKIFIFFIVTVFLNAVVAILQFTTQSSITASKWLGTALHSPEQAGVSAVETFRGRWMRAYGFQPHPNILAGFLSIGQILIWYLYFKYSTSRFRSLFVVASAFLLAALLFTFSRSGILSLAVAFAFYLFWIYFNVSFETIKGFLKKNVFYVFLLAALAGVLVFSTSNLVKTRIMSSERLENISIEQRISGYYNFKEIFISNWYGTGYGMYTYTLALFNPLYPDYSLQPVHNGYMLALSEIGVFGFTLFIVFILYLLYNLKSVRGSVGEKMVLVLALIQILVISVFDHYFWSIPSAFLFFIIILALIHRVYVTNRSSNFN